MADEKQVDIQLPKYYKSDFKKLSWEKYFKVLDKVLARVKNYLKENNKNSLLASIHGLKPVVLRCSLK